MKIELTKDEINMIYEVFIQEMEKVFERRYNLQKSKIYKNGWIPFKLLENWYLFLKKIKDAKDQYEQNEGVKDE